MQCQEKGQAYTIKDKLWKEGEIKLIVCPLTDSNGFIMEVSGERLPEELKLCWAFGACDGADAPAVTDNSIPAASCFHNVFSIEGNAFTTYYGESMKLRTVHGVSPIGSEIRLSDGHKQASPLALFNSGKRQMPPSSLPYARGNRKKSSTSVSTNEAIIIISCYPDYSGKNIKPDQNETIVSIPVLPFLCLSAQAQEFKVYQFPADKVPAIDGNTHDWDCVPADYKITEAALKEDEGKHAQPDTTTLKVSVKVGWCAETQKLYFLYEAYDNYWRFSENSLNTDILK